MGFYRGPHVVTDGLVLWLDAANPRSYPGSGTAWRDLSGLGNNGTLTNGPTFSSANYGSIAFDGVDDYVNCGNIGDYTTRTYTLSAWFYPGFDFILGGRSIIAKNTNCSTAEFVLEYGRVANKIIFLTRDDLTLTSTNTYPKNNWHHAVLTRTNNGNGTYTSILYVNGLLDNTVTVNYAGAGGSGNLTLGVAFGCTAIGYFNGNISTAQIYNRALTPQEVKQNYYALKGRYNLI